MAKKKMTKDQVQLFVHEEGYPELGHFEEKKDLQNFYKHLTMEQLEQWIELEGLSYNPTESDSINRMRACMAILYAHFPKQTKPKKQSKYAQYTLEDLVNMAIEHQVVFEETDDERILRMRAIMALRAAGKID